MTRAVTAMTDIVPFIGPSFSHSFSSPVLYLPEKFCDYQCSADPYDLLMNPDPTLGKMLFIYF